MSSLTIEPASLKLKEGEVYKKLKAKYAQAKSGNILNPIVTWTSSDPSVITVDPKTGVVTAAKKLAKDAKRTAVLTASALIDSVPVTKTVNVEVQNSSALSDGAIAGIVIAGVFVLILLIWLITWAASGKSSEGVTKSASPRKSASPLKSASPVKSPTPYKSATPFAAATPFAIEQAGSPAVAVTEYFSPEVVKSARRTPRIRLKTVSDII